MALKQLFFPKNCQTIFPKNLSQIPKASRRWGPRPQIPVCDTFELHWHSQHVSIVRYLHFLTISLSSFPFAKSWLSANWQIFDDVIACGLWFRPPQSKILATPITRRSLEKLFEDLFFFENTCCCVLGLEPCVLASTSGFQVRLHFSIFLYEH